MYMKCDKLSDACRYFTKMYATDVFSWTLIITYHVESGYYEQALGLFWRMSDEGVISNKVTCLSVVKACTSLLKVRLLFSHIVEMSLDSDSFLTNNLVHCYSKHRSLDDAFFLFQRMDKNDTVPWNTMLAGFSQNGFCNQAFALFSQMIYECVKPDEVTYLAVLKSCVNHGCTNEVRKIHVMLVEDGMESNNPVANTIIDLYARCMNIEDAEATFNKMCKRDAVSWSVMITGHIQHLHAEKALFLFNQMLFCGSKPEKSTYMSALKACVVLKSSRRGRLIHFGIVLHHLEHDPFIRSSLIDMYMKSGNTEDACFIFANMPQQDTVICNSLINGYTDIRESREALVIFRHMVHQCLRPDEATFVSLLKACINLADLEQGRQIHSYAAEDGMDFHFQVVNILTEMYAKCNCMKDALHVLGLMYFQPSGLVRHTFSNMKEETQHCLNELKRLEYMTPIKYMFSSDSELQGSWVHSNQGSHAIMPITCVKADSMSFAHGDGLDDKNVKIDSTFRFPQGLGSVLQRDIVPYNTIISVSVEKGLCNLAMDVFSQMIAHSVIADIVTYISILKACIILGSLEQGMQVHVLATEVAYDGEDILKGIFIDMYMKYGYIKDAENIFEHSSKHDTLSWTAMVSGYAQHGLPWKAIQFLEQMHKEGAELDEITFISAFSACSYGGLVDKGLHLCYVMCRILGVIPNTQHFACMIDLLGRAGCLYDAVLLLHIIPFHPANVMFTTLLAACKLHDDSEILNFSLQCIQEVAPDSSGCQCLFF
ncbi:hypothetical protein KP509_04G010500 [Ceratopteris richardii]|nr:hypothetical protein KP509_04G010500 [Ceratopteris richardii]